MDTTENVETLNGRFLLVRRIGLGSDCEVFEAEDLAYARRRVTVKKLRAHATPAALQSLRSEFSVLSRLRHPHVVEAFDLHVVPGTEPAFAALELIDGQPFLEATRGMPVARVLRLLCQVCAGLAYLHKHGFVHRDIRSDSILVERPDTDPHVKIMDPRLTGVDGQPLSAGTVGKPRYLPPEVLAGQPGDLRSDLFSIGVLAYRVLVGSFPCPVTARDSSETTAATPPLARLHVLAPHLATEICFIIERLLSVDPDHRFQTAEELENALRQHAESTGTNKVSLVPPAARWPFVGRREELSYVRTAIDRLAAVNGHESSSAERSFMVLGEAGAGKSRFLREIARACQLAGMPAFIVDAARLSGEPFGPVHCCLKQIEGWVEHLPPRDAICRTLLASCKRLLQSLASEQDSSLTVWSEECDTWVQDQFVQLLAELSLAHPFAVLVDNFQHIDIASRHCLLALMQDETAARFLTALATRPEPTQSARRPAPRPVDLVQRIELGPLSEDDMGSLLGDLFPSSAADPRVAAQFDRLTGGQPVFLDLVIQALRADGMIETRHGEPHVDPHNLRALAVPVSIQTWVSDWIERCPATELRVLEALAVTGRPTEPEVIAHLLAENHSVTTVESNIEALLERGALHRDAGVVTGAVSTSHALVLEAVYEKMEANERKHLHQRCVELLRRDHSADASVKPAMLTRHRRAAGRKEEAAEWAIQAAEQAAKSLACDEAERLFRIGLAGARRDAPRSRLRALGGLAEMLRQLKRFEEAGDLFQTLTKEATEASDGGFLVRGLAGLASSCLSRSDYKQAEELSKRALRIAREIGDPVAEDRALSSVANTFHYQSKLPEAKQAYAQRVALWEREGDGSQAATALYGLGWVCNSMREFADAATYLERSTEIRRRLDTPARLANSLSALGANELDRGDFRAAVGRLEEALTHARVGRSRSTEAICLSNLGEARFRLGQFRQALDAQHEALRRISTLSAPRLSSAFRLSAGLILTDQGEYPLAEKHLAQARDACLEIEDQPRLAHCLAAQGTIHRLLGDATTARFWCERGLEMARKAKDDLVTAVCLTHLALAYFEEDRGQQAVEHLLEARSVAHQTGAADTAHQADLALARVLVLSDRSSETAGLFEQLMERAKNMQLVADMTQLLFLRALRNAHSGQRREAARLADEGLSRAASSSSAEVYWELRRLRLLLMDDQECADAERLERDADAWVASCSAALTDESRRKAFERRLRNRQDLFTRMVREANSPGSPEPSTTSRSDVVPAGMPEQRQSVIQTSTSTQSSAVENPGQREGDTICPTDASQAEPPLAMNDGAAARNREATAAVSCAAQTSSTRGGSRAPDPARPHHQSNGKITELQSTERDPSRCDPRENSRSTSDFPIGHADLRAGTHLLSRYLPELMHQRQLRSALNLFVDRAIQMTRSDRGGLFLHPGRGATTSVIVSTDVAAAPTSTLSHLDTDAPPSSDSHTAAPGSSGSVVAAALSSSPRTSASSSSHPDTASTLSPARHELVPLVLRDLEREALEDAREMSRCVLDAAFTSEQVAANAELLRDPAWSSRHSLRLRETPTVLAIPLFRVAAITPPGSSTAPGSSATLPASGALGVLYLDRTTRGRVYDHADRMLGERFAATLVELLDPILSAAPDTSILDNIAALTERLPIEAIASLQATASDDVGTRFGDVLLVGSGREMDRVFDLTRRLAASRIPVLITGETGTGKELIARALHDDSPRCDEPFVALDCGTLPESLAEAELFGHARDAFPGAASDRLGLMRTAARGTLFLDEIGNLASPLQLKLLRALETGEVRPLGTDRAFTAPFRLVTATNTDLDAAVRQGTFRADLLHRLKGGHIDLPPLRAHMHDLETLVAYLLGKLCEETSRPTPRLSPALWERLHRHDWPGNVCELRVALEAAIAMNGGEVLGVEDMPAIAKLASHPQPAADRPATRAPAAAPPPLSAAGIDVPTALEGRMILRTLAQNQWDKSATARQIGWSRQKLYRAMKKYGIPNRVADEQIRALAECIQTLTICIDAPPINTTRQ